MARWKKAAAGIGGVLLLAIVAGGLALHSAFDPEQVRTAIRDRARAMLSRDIEIGHASLELLPWPTVHVRDVALPESAAAHAAKIFSAERISARLSLLPLLLGKFAFDEIALKRGVANLDVLADGSRLELKIDSARVESLPELRNVNLDAQVSSHDRPLHVKAHFDDLSHLGKPDAATRGSILLDWGKTRAEINGTLPLNEAMKGEAFEAKLHSESLEDVFAFLGVQRATAPVEARADVRETDGIVGYDAASIALGKQRITGSVHVDMTNPKRRTFTASVHGDRLDWKQAFRDYGDPERAPLPPDEMLYDDPLPWGVLAVSHNASGTIEASFGTLVLPNGIVTTDAKSHMVVQGDRLDLKPFSANLLGGSAAGSMHFEGGKKRVHVDMTASKVLLERWFHERGRNIAFKGGPMNVKASITMTGDSMKKLAATMTGPVTIRMGPGVYANKAAGDWEARMAHFTKKSSAEEVVLECVTASLPFNDGRASGNDIVGGRSTLSRLLLSGSVDLRRQDLDLRGKVHPLSGTPINLASIAGDVEFNGKLRQPKAKLDPAAKPKMVAKAGVAIATAGLGLIAESQAASAPGPDPCETVARNAPAAKAPATRVARR